MLPKSKASAHPKNFKNKMEKQHTVQPTPNRISTFPNEHASIIIEPNHTSILPLHLLRRSNNNGVPYISSADFIGSGNGDLAAWTGFRAEIPLLLHYYDYAVSCFSCQLGYLALLWLDFRGMEVRGGLAIWQWKDEYWRVCANGMLAVVIGREEILLGVG